MRSRAGTLAGILNGRRRRGLGETWDCRYHCYLDSRSGRLFTHRPAIRLQSAPAAPDVSELTAPVAEHAEPLRQAS
jgi:hypothetical protein